MSLITILQSNYLSYDFLFHFLKYCFKSDFGTNSTYDLKLIVFTKSD